MKHQKQVRRSGIMTIDEQNVLIERLIDEFAKKMTELFGPLDIPRYLLFESLHPQKKPRGSIRRRRRQNENTSA